ncbi:hypothetical protein [Beijerinckia indica]|uniref:Uncharacterized protein n=1 Tax=Beijerinckia indica subsp. indica (strain ATCC 9039 / DSM 1715 / NCIMB 8712) TaxID=395963 RepID=B2ILI4_BEII9|nr:hypothetical protein [Beijerinckia indica]ACB97384.1 hypothetical protein Bind_3855 [Beijerinckia indica subsp. indica ATCC 9039]
MPDLNERDRSEPLRFASDRPDPVTKPETVKPEGKDAGAIKPDAETPKSADTTAKSPDAHEPKKEDHDELRQLIMQLEIIRANRALPDKLGEAIKELRQDADTPAKLDDPTVRTKLAYAVQDAEKVGAVLSMPQALRDQLRKSGTTLPNLRNEGMQALLKDTPNIDDHNLVTKIRLEAANTTTLPDQHTQETNSKAATLENEARLAQRIPEAQQTQAAAATINSAERQAEKPATQANNQAAPPSRQDANQIFTDPEITGIKLRLPGAAAEILSNLGPERSKAENADAQRVSLFDRLSNYQANVLGPRNEEKAIQSTFEAGADANAALQEFSNGPGRAIMAKIEQAAKSKPEGMAGVLSEMRSGGRYADLRGQFDQALLTEKNLAASYDKATSALANYADKRAAIEPVIAKQPDAGALAAKLQQVDASVGEKAEVLPGRKEGENALEELAKKAGEAISKAVEKIQGAIQRFTGNAEHSASASPRPSP